MSMVPYAGVSTGNEMLKQMALAKLMRNPGDELEQTTVAGMIAGSAAGSLRELDNRSAESLARRIAIIDSMKVDDVVKGQLQQQALGADQAWSALMLKAGDAITGLIR
jgi:hypothetical protein